MSISEYILCVSVDLFISRTLAKLSECSTPTLYHFIFGYQIYNPASNLARTFEANASVSLEWKTTITSCCPNTTRMAPRNMEG